MSEKKQTPAQNSFDDIEKKVSIQNLGFPDPVRTKKTDVSSTEKADNEKRGKRNPPRNSAPQRQPRTRQSTPSRQNFSYDIPKDPLAKPTVFDEIRKKIAKALSRLPMKKISIIGGSAVSVLLIGYIAAAITYSDQFLPNTYINEIAVSGMTKTEASDALLSSVETDALVLTKPDGSTVRFDTAGYDAHYSVSDEALNEAFSENRFLWLGKLFQKSNYTVEYDYDFSVNDLHEMIISYNWGCKEAENAYIKKGSDGKFKIIPATQGERFDTEVLLTYISEQLAVGNFTITMENSGCYEGFAAEIQAEDLTEELALCERFNDCSVTFDFGDRQEILAGETIAEWVQLIEGSTITFDRSKIETFVDDMANTYDTFGNALKFDSTLDGTITVPWTETSVYGWLIHRENTVDHIIELLQNVESVTTEPIYVEWGTGYCRDAESGDIGNTYVEIDISAQHVWYYKNGEIFMDSDCVSGKENDPGRRTPRGIFYIWNHEEDRILVGDDYEQFVDYWMPVNHEGVGLHDLNRSEYGGDIYMDNGSHGCINLPLYFAEKLFHATEDGVPVIVHD